MEELTPEEISFLANLLIQVSKEAETEEEFEMIHRIVGKLHTKERP